jgi:endonuclease/exonuclease/phosphatase family metal-dependent hydrolase
MSDLKLLVWNMEWMNDLFVPNDQPAAFRPDDEKTQHNSAATVKQRREHLAGVINELAPDMVVCVEGPNRNAELQLFFDHQDVQGDWTAVIQTSKGMSQNVGFAARTDTGKFNNPPFKQFDTNNIPAFDPFDVDTDDDEILERYHFERRPLYVEVNPLGGKNFRVVGLHLKSKAIFKAYEWSKWWSIADANRRKILAQATRLRLNFLDPYLSEAQTSGIPLIVSGDINDGPGLDASEKRLFGSGVERLMGAIWKPHLCLRNALFDALAPKDQAGLLFEKIATTRYSDPIFNNVFHREWIDHVMYSDNQDGQWVSEGEVHEKMPDGKPVWAKYRFASDHYPITVKLTT